MRWHPQGRLALWRRGRRRFAADANADEDDEDVDGEKTPDFLDVLFYQARILSVRFSPGNGSGASHA